MPRKSIPAEIKNEVERIVSEFNRDVLKSSDCYYVSRYRGRYLYLDRVTFGCQSQICRLTYTGKIEDWEFAIFKYSSERDPDEWLFPGSQFIDGTVEGAMKARMEAYPC